jgi:hypothetical protein
MVKCPGSPGESWESVGAEGELRSRRRAVGPPVGEGDGGGAGGRGGSRLGEVMEFPHAALAAVGGPAAAQRDVCRRTR